MKGEHEQNAHNLNLKNCKNVKNHTGKATRGKFLRFGNLQKIIKSGVWWDVLIKHVYIDAEFEVR